MPSTPARTRRPPFGGPVDPVAAPGGAADPVAAPGGPVDPVAAPGGAADPVAAPGGAVDVWWIELTERADVADCMAVLSPDELADVRRRRRREDAEALAVSRAALRGILASYLGVAPEDVPLERRCHVCGGPHGRPVLRGAAPALHCSLSRARTHAAVAVGRAALGVDVERIRALPDLANVAEAFAPAEQAALKALPEAERVGAFHTLWARKEAYLKARGEGLTRDLKDFVVSAPHEPAAVLSSAAGDAAAIAMADLPTPDAALVAALAIAAPKPAVRTLHWPGLGSDP
jgi:4'-phosphopantetheinyl transferase